MTEATSFGSQIDSHPVGSRHDSVELDDGRTISVGDIAVFDDELDHRDIEEGIHDRIFVGKVEGILKPARDGVTEPEVFLSAGVGRVPVSDLEVSGEGSRVDPQSGVAKFIDQFLNSEYEDELVVEWGDGIGPDGEDHRRRGK